MRTRIGKQQSNGADMHTGHRAEACENSTFVLQQKFARHVEHPYEVAVYDDRVATGACRLHPQPGLRPYVVVLMGLLRAVLASHCVLGLTAHGRDVAGIAMRGVGNVHGPPTGGVPVVRSAF